MVVYPMVPSFFISPSQSQMSSTSLRVNLSFQKLAYYHVQIPIPPVLSVPISMRRTSHAGHQRNLRASADLPLSIRHLVQLKVGLLPSQIKLWTLLRPQFMNLALMGDKLYPPSHSITSERRLLKTKPILVIAR